MATEYEAPRILNMGSYLDYLANYSNRITVTAFLEGQLKTVTLAELPAKIALQWAAHWWNNREIPEVDGVVYDRSPKG